MNMQQREREDIHAHAGTNTSKNDINKEPLFNQKFCNSILYVTTVFLNERNKRFYVAIDIQKKESR